MLKNSLLTLIFTLLCYTSVAEIKKYSVNGSVETADNLPAEYVYVSLKGTYYGGVTNAEGRFQFEAPAGEYTMVVASIAAHNQELNVTIRPDDSNSFPRITVMELAQQLEQVVVTGQFSPQSLNSSVYKVRAISAAQIAQKAPANLEALLNTEIGVRISNDMTLGESDPEIMGMSGNNVKVLLDGIPIVDRLSTKQSLNQIDINTIERVEIVEGPMAVAYGTDALAGVINIITKKGKTTGQERLRVGARIQEESVGQEYYPLYNKGRHMKSVHAEYGFKNGLYWGGSFTRNDFGGWQGEFSGRKKEWPAKFQNMPSFHLGLKKQRYDLSYRVDYLDEQIWIKGDVPQNQKATDVRYPAQRYSHQLHANWEAHQRLKLSLAASYQDYRRDKESRVINFATAEQYPSRDQGAADQSSYTIGFVRTTALWRAATKLNLQAGMEYQYNQGEGDKIEAQHNTIHNAALFLSTEYTPLPWLSLRPGVRSSYNSTYRAPPAIPSINTKIRLNEKIDLRLSYGRGFRAPTLQELYYTFYHVGGGGFWIKGNAELKAEESDSYMASWSWRLLHGGNVRLTTNLTGFFNHFTDRIQMVPSVRESSTQTYYNTGKYQTLGLTWENTLVWKALRATLNLSYIGRYNTLMEDPTFANFKQQRFRYSPELSSGITYRWAKVATVSVFYKYTASREEYRELSGKLLLAGLKGYHWADVSLSRPIAKCLDIQTGIKNLFDVTRVENRINTPGMEASGALSASVIGCGRSYWVGVSFKFKNR